jgi:tetratricopeptide (TPR) repeat protein
LTTESVSENFVKIMSIFNDQPFGFPNTKPQIAPVKTPKPSAKRERAVAMIAIGLMLLGVLPSCGDASRQTDSAQQTISQPIPESDDLMQRAKDRSSRGDTLGAIISYGELLLEKPDAIAALGNRAILLAALGRDQEALADYGSLLQIDSENYPALDRRAALNFRMGHYQDALLDLDYMASHRKEDPELLNRLGEAHLRLGRFAEALYHLEQALAIRKDWPVALRNRAATYYAMGDYDRAAYDYQTLLARDPQDSEALNGLGLVFQFADNDALGAETNFRKALLANPNNAGAWYNIAFLEASQNKTQAAIKDFGEAIRSDRRYADAYVNRGLLRMRLPDQAAALADFEAALSLQPTNAHNRLLVGWAKCETGARTAGCLDLAEAKSKSEPGAADLIATYCK